MTQVHKLYDRLAPLERFRMIIAARAREDLPEVRRLEMSTPRKTYEMHDAAVVELANSSRLVAAAFLLLWHESMVKWLVLYTHESTRNDGRVERDGVADALIELGAMWHGFKTMCAGVDINPSELLRAWLGPVCNEVLAMEEALPGPGYPLVGAQVLERSAAFRALFVRTWEGTELQGASARG